MSDERKTEIVLAPTILIPEIVPKADKAKWGDGPWVAEPDYVEFKYNEMDCYIVRHPGLGHLCGYVSIPKKHSLFGAGYSDTVKLNKTLREKKVDLDKTSIFGLMCSSKNEVSLDCVLTVHGGLTFSGPELPSTIIGKTKGWYLGFDCSHSGDITPHLNEFMKSIGGSTYKTIGFVTEELTMLTDQILLWNKKIKIKKK